MTKTAEIIAVGSELLLGEILNSNAQFLAQALAKLGIAHHFQSVVGDNCGRIQQAIAIAKERSQLLIFTGGLGPTPDDLTTETIADFFQAPLVEHPEIWTDIQAKFAQRQRVPSPNNRKQAYLPRGASILPNPVGSAPGMIWTPVPGLTILTFPGVPRELQAMWQDTAVPFLQQQGWSQGQIYSRVLRFWGISESQLAEDCQDLLALTAPTVAPYASRGEIRLRISARAQSEEAAQALIQPVEDEIRRRAGKTYFGTDDETLSSVVGQLLRQNAQTLAVAESCTGGGLGQRLTAISGSSDYFLGGVIAYHNRVKIQQLEVNAQDLAQSGAVSAVVAEQMALGVQRQFQSSWGLSITGIAGPTGSTADKPVGLVYIGLASPQHQARALTYHASGYRGRDWVRDTSIASALDYLRRALLDCEVR